MPNYPITEAYSKRQWVNTYVDAMFKTSERMDIDSIRYRIDGAEEYVIVTFKNGYTKRVCVTGDSDKAILMDILKVV